MRRWIRSPQKMFPRNSCHDFRRSNLRLEDGSLWTTAPFGISLQKHTKTRFGGRLKKIEQLLVEIGLYRPALEGNLWFIILSFFWEPFFQTFLSSSLDTWPQRLYLRRYLGRILYVSRKNAVLAAPSNPPAVIDSWWWITNPAKPTDEIGNPSLMGKHNSCLTYWLHL